MSLFAIADLHLSLGTNKQMDIFPGWENYTERLKENWDKVVSPDDTVVIAGDVSWGMNFTEALEDFKFIHERPGKKLILKGNHDYWWSTRKKTESFFEENGFYSLEIIHNSACPVGNVAVCGTRGWMYNSASPEDMKIIAREAGRLKASIIEAEKSGKLPVVFLHYPPVYDNFESREFLDILHEHGIKTCYYGHIHGRLASKKVVTGDFEGIEMRLIACDYVHFCPVLAIK